MYLPHPPTHPLPLLLPTVLRLCEQVKLICDRCPKLIKERDRRGFTPLHLALMNNNNLQVTCGPF